MEKTFILVFSLIMLTIVIVTVAGMWKVFEKANQPGWACIVPIYNAYILLKIVGKPSWWLLLFFIPIANYVFAIWTFNMLSKSFGKDEGFTVGLVLLYFIFIPILGFSNAKYLGPYGDAVAFQAYNEPQFDFENPNPTY